MTIAVTGHRPNKLGFEYDYVGPYSLRIMQWLTAKAHEYECTDAISGLALGVDMMWAKVAINNRIPLIAAVPFVGQEKMWPKKSQQTYKELLEEATKIVYVCDPGYAAWKMQKRNEWMVDNCQLLLAVWDGSSGGTANCVEYAKKTQRQTLIFNPHES